MMKLRSFFYVLAAMVLALLLVGAAGFYWISAHSPLALLRSGRVAEPAAAMFVPKQAPVMVSLLTNPDNLEAFRQVLAPPGKRRESRAEIDQFKRNLLANTGVDYRRDIRPWLGNEITFAIATSDIDRNSQNGRQPGYLLAVATQEPERSREFLERFWQKQAGAGADVVHEQNQGVTIIYSQAARKPERQKLGAIASAAVGDRFILFANDPKVIRDAINNVQAPDLSLNRASHYQEALQQIRQQQIGLAFFNLAALPDWVNNKSVEKTSSSSYKSLIISWELTRQGLLAETSAIAKEKMASSLQLLEKPVGTLQYLPASTIFASAGKGLPQPWTQLSANLSSDNFLNRWLNQPLESLQNRWGIQLPEEIFSWVKGEYALGALPRSDREEPDWIFVAEKSADTDAAIAHLDAIAKRQGFSVAAFNLENQNIFAWTKLGTAPASNLNTAASPMELKAQVQGVYTTVGKYEILTTSIEAMNQALKAPQNSLLTSRDFQASVANLSRPNQGYVYLNWPSNQTSLERQLPVLNQIELFAKPLFNHLRSLTFSHYGSDDSILRGGIFLTWDSKRRQISRLTFQNSEF